ncbi:hypothetical protein [Nitratireductor sp. OM-1]|uniref:AbiU2 domain-containing protein n=1 Tax=Nitratireductor sp. OM-1 TaxID=1756988 RepID=UPI000DDD3DA0|nr:hypothetical protein [Nitratireductor sp. OM-1]
MVDHICSLFQMHEANVFAIYNGTLARQIPRSYAGHAFNQFQASMYLFEVIRLAALWDTPGDDRESIPTIVKLIDKAEILNAVIDDTRAYYLNEMLIADLNPVEDPLTVEAKQHWLQSYRGERAHMEIGRTKERFRAAINGCAAVVRSEQLQSIRAYRDRYIAHNLDLPDAKLGEKTNVPRAAKYGDETWVLEKTVEIADNLHLALNGSSFDWDGSRDIARRSSEQLWSNCRFDIPTRQSRRSGDD